jgi:hypothetical protein
MAALMRQLQYCSSSDSLTQHRVCRPGRSFWIRGSERMVEEWAVGIGARQMVISWEKSSLISGEGVKSPR